MAKYQQGDVDYLVGHKIPDVVDKLIRELLEKKPEDALPFMSDRLLEMHTQGPSSYLSSGGPGILIFGPNGCGKGTQGAIVKKQWPGLEQIESGVIFREQIKAGTELGQKAKVFIDKGELVPDDLTVPMVLAVLKEKGTKGWLLDGFPRSLNQAKLLWSSLQKEGMPVTFVIEILLPREVAKNRIVGRRVCSEDGNHPNNIFLEAIKPNGENCRVCGAKLSTRADDQDETAIGKRHDIYYDTKEGSLAAAYYFKGLAKTSGFKYVECDGLGSIDAIKENLIAQLK